MRARSACLRYVLLLSACGCATAQSPVTTIYPSTPVSADERAFALSLSTMTLDQAKAAMSHADKSLLSTGSTYALLALAGKVRTSHPETALLIEEEGLEIARGLKDQLLIGAVLFSEGDAHRFAGDPEAAVTAYDASLAAYSAGDAGPGRLAIPLSGRALAKRDMGDIEGAIDDARLNLAGNKEAGDQVGMARALNTLGNAEQTLGDFQQAREDYQQGLVLARAQKQRLGEAFLLNNIANAYLQEDNPELATDYCLQSIKIKEELGIKDDLVSSLVILAHIYQRARKPAEAIQVLDRASTLAHESNRPALIAVVSSARNAIEIDLQHYDVALQGLTEVVNSMHKEGNRTYEYETREEISDLELTMQHYADSARDAEQVLAFAVDGGFEGIVADAAYIDGSAQQQLGHMAQAHTAFETSVAAYEAVRENVAGGDQARSEFFSHHSEAYQALAALDASQGRAEEALLISEREKGRALLDLLTHGKSSLSKELTAPEKTEENHLRLRLATLEEQRRDAALQNVPNPSGVAALDRQMQGAHTAIGSFRERMSAAHPDLDRHRGNANLITLAQTASLVPNASTAILEYEVTPAATYLFVIVPRRGGPALHVYTLPIASSALSARVSHFSKAIAARDQGFATAASELYRLLLAPAKVDLAGKHSLIIVPSADLWHLPFQALRDPAGKYLLEAAAISYAPSLSVLHAYMMQKHSASAGHTLLAFGDPTDNLPEAAREAKTVASLYSPSEARNFTGAAATKENFNTYAAHYDIVHLATHGLFDDHDPMYSHLLFAGSTSDPSRSRTAQLDASEIADMKLSASLVVLSACETADGKYLAGEGLIGLSWSFLAAGSQSAIASQWRVASSSTTDLMIAFHRNLQQHIPKAEALRRAELTLAHDPRYDHPFYWAGFVLLGEN
jgi:CHAT domain-containing protein